MSYPSKVTKTIKEFCYLSPNSVAEAVSMLQRFDAEVLAGGTDLLPMMKQREVTPEFIVNIKKIPDLAYIREDDDGLKIGALTTIFTIKESDIIRQKYISIYEAAKNFAYLQIRNMATVGGNICRSSPSADMVPPLMAFDAVVKLVGPKGSRNVLLENFFKGSRQNVLELELLTEIVIPRKDGRYGTAFGKMKRNSGDLAKVNGAVKIIVRGRTCEDIRIVLGAVAPKPLRARSAEQAMKARIIEEDVIEAAAQKVAEDIAPITDVRSTSAYRTEVSKVLIRRLIKLAIERS
ncbi:MAG: xanthine dehydrogenase family protein subunit M [Candidatus Tectomicrobia bacterium]|uniref:Xanthine dehydrogenase family protein subunit M n=1 Tax=Tectimicrobiota bacterium TaxID=2528274 RepID=A0A933GL99_UNCTE|nr:xanthine dehydrogenase family protein subunit M [Candidatus Tectomicrobia bacterium]